MMKSMARTACARRDNLTGQGSGWGRLVRMAAVGVMLVAAFSGTKSVAEEAVDINLDAGSINLFGFYNGMPKADAEALAAHYGIEIKEDTFKANPETHEVYEINISVEDVRRISNGPETPKELVRFLVVERKLKTPNPKLFSRQEWDWRGDYNCYTYDGVIFNMSETQCQLLDSHRYQEAQMARENSVPRMGIYSTGIANEIEENDYD